MAYTIQFSFSSLSVFQIAVRGKGKFSPTGGRMGNFAGDFFSLGGGNLVRSDFAHENLFLC